MDTLKHFINTDKYNTELSKGKAYVQSQRKILRDNIAKGKVYNNYKDNREWEIYDNKGVVGGPYYDTSDAQADSKWLNNNEGHHTKVRVRK